MRPQQSGTNVFTIFGFGLLLLSIVASAGIFGYQKYLESVRDADAAELEAAKSQINRTTVEDFIRTRDRFVAAKDILNNHIAFSQYLNILEGLTLQTVRFANLRYTLAPTGNASIQMTGSARSFNALAAEASAFTGAKEFKRAIFSGIGLNEKDNTVTFVFSAEIDKSVILANIPTNPVMTLPIATGTPATSTPTGISTHATTTSAKTGTATP